MNQSVTHKSSLSYFRWAFIVTALGLVLGAVLGWQTTGTIGGMATVFFICTVLAVLEISLSFDNAIVNANKLKEMTPVWQKRFLTWGIIIAVFGMRIVFPLAIVAIAAQIGPWDALVLAARELSRICPHHERRASADRSLRRHLPDDGRAQLLLQSREAGALDWRS